MLFFLISKKSRSAALGVAWGLATLCGRINAAPFLIKLIIYNGVRILFLDTAKILLLSVKNARSL